MTKQIALYFDGTWNSADQAFPTDVTKLHQATKEGEANGKDQVVFYDEGVGVEGIWLERILGGVSGRGLEENIAQGYKKLIDEHEDGDEIYLFGYSRGAYTGRSLAGLIRNCGILRPEHMARIPGARKLYRKRGSGPESDEAKQLKDQYSKVADIHFIGVWDTVRSRGLPLKFIGRLYNWRFSFHDVTLSRSVKHAYHAIAIDEKRGPFKPSIWSNLPITEQSVEQVWFAGVHSNIGGGAPDPGLSEIALSWIAGKARDSGLELDWSLLPEISQENWAATIQESRKGFYKFISEHRRTLGRANRNTEALHSAAKTRYDSEEPVYEPENLKRYLRRSDYRIADE